ncbi:MAG: InlB B-repeat-containing protein [Dehalococcoidales bacterium]|nr:MAG: InlB B-repeat-containing protein [Dehalococcoidales bacterium]
MNVSTTEGGKVKVDDFIPIEYPDISSVAKGAFVTLEAIPRERYTFLGWSGSISSEENPVTLEMDCAKMILANFSKQFTLTMEVEGAGSVTPLEGTHRYGENTVVDISATPDEGYQFDGWTGEVSDIDSASTKVTIDSDTTIRAHFSKNSISTGMLIGIVTGSIILIGSIVWVVTRRLST